MNRCKNSRRKAPLGDIVTYDGDFDHIVGVTVWRPQPVGASFMTPWERSNGQTWHHQ